jgi:hypothetical protein
MKIRNGLTTVACLFFILGAADCALGQTGRPPSPSIVTGGAPPGRFQIVNGTPTMTQNIMLLDTVTGESWILCETANRATGWCRMPRSESGSSLNRPDRVKPDSN